jgi:broad specificity phosphatase PhoE
MASSPNRTVWVVRHGESDWNAAGMIQGHRDDPTLTLRGRYQARRIARRLSQRPITRIVSSDLQRAIETAGPLSQILGLRIETDVRLRERHLGALEGRPASQLTPSISGVAGEKVVDVSAKPEGGESLTEFFQRVASFMEELHSSEPGEVALFAHGGSVRLIHAMARGVGVDGLTWPRVDNGAVLRVLLPLARLDDSDRTES